MDYLTTNELLDFYDSLPDDLQDAVFSAETMEIYDQIKERYALDDAQREQLSVQSGFLMMGITDPKDYVLRLAETLQVPRDKAAFIAQEVNRGILHNVRDSLKEVHGLAPGQTSAPISGVVPSAPSQYQAPPPPPTARQTPVASPLPPVPPPPLTALNEKLSDDFRVSTPEEAGVPDYSTPAMEILEPMPASATPPPPPPPPPTPPPQATQSPQTPRASDPYRELVQ